MSQKKCGDGGISATPQMQRQILLININNQKIAAVAMCFSDSRVSLGNIATRVLVSDKFDPYTIRNAWITILIPLEYFDVMHIKSLRKLIPPEFSDVMIT